MEIAPNKAKNKVFVIIGPTSSGKTSLAINLAKKFNGTIVSADSRQMYRHMNIGTGKVPVTSDINVENMVNYWVLDDVVVWGYDLVEPDKYFSAYDYALWALEKIREILEQGKTVFLVGGTGFFIDFVTGRVKPAKIPPDFKLRKELEKLNTTELVEKLTSLNPEVLETIDRENPARLIRAIEIALGEKKNDTPLPYLENIEFVYFGLNASREFLFGRVDTWMETVWNNGLIEETKQLLAKGYEKTKMLNGLVYKSALAFIRGEDTEEMLIQKAKFDLHAYIRRQQTYFKKMGNIKWFDIEKEGFAEDVVNTVESIIYG